ncbi:MAG: hypothetical protein ACREML_14240 [Vulcanimicrobiaceae bacterium]
MLATEHGRENAQMPGDWADMHGWPQLAQTVENVVIDVDGDCGATSHLFENAQLAARFNAPYTIGLETGIPVMVCRGIREPLSEVWPSLKAYI